MEMLRGSPILFSWYVIGIIFSRETWFFFYLFVIAHIWFLRKRERILGIMCDAWTVSIFLRECILQSGIGDTLLMLMLQDVFQYNEI